MSPPPRLQRSPIPPAPPRHPPSTLPLPTPRRPRSPLNSPLPSLRILLHPSPGLGVDLRLPLSKRLRCYMQLDSLFNGPSTIRIGVHPRGLQGLRFQLSPTPKVSVRLPVRLHGAKYVHVGLTAESRWGLDTDWRRWEWGADVWENLGKVRMCWRVAPFVEFWRYTTANGLVDRRVRDGLREAIGKRRFADGLDGNGLDSVPVDPRERDGLLEALTALSRQRTRRRALQGDGDGEGGGQAMQ